MELKKLFHVLVVGGAALTLTHCGQGTSDTKTDGSGVTNPSTNPDGGMPDGGTDPGTGGDPGGGGPPSW